MKLSELMQSDNYTTFLDDLDKHIPEKIDRRSKAHKTILTMKAQVSTQPRQAKGIHIQPDFLKE